MASTDPRTEILKTDVIGRVRKVSVTDTMTSAQSEESSSLTCPPAEGVLVHADARGRLRVSKEQRKAVLAKFEQSGMSAAKFAAAAGIKYSTLAGWLQR